MMLAPAVARRWLWIGLFFSIPLTGADSIAQQPVPDLAEASLEQLGDIQVYSASQHMQSAEDAPSSVTVVTAGEILEFGYRTLADILRTVPGFYVTYDRNYSSLGVRGFARPGDYNTRILLLIDGHRLNDNVYDDALIGTELPLDIDLIQRVEIVRGPVSSLYGSNALFAVINIITKRGRDLNGLELSSEAASFDTYAGRMSYGRTFQQLEFLVSGTFYGSRGQKRLFYPEFNTPETNNGIASHADDDQVGSALITASSHDLTLEGLYGVREKGIPTASFGTIFNDPRTRTTDSHLYADLRYEHTFHKSLGILARTFYDRMTYHGVYIYPPVSGSSQGSNPNLDYGDGKWWGLELQASKTLKHNRVTGGGEYRDNILQYQTNYDLDPYSLYVKDKRHSFVGAAYLQDELAITKSLAMNLGLRYDYYSNYSASINPRAAFIYRPGRSTNFKFIYAEAFRIPNVYEQYYYSANSLTPSPNLKPEKIRTAEVDWDQKLLSYLSVSTSAFYTRMNDLISQDATSLAFHNLQGVRATGLELELKGQLYHGLNAVASYSIQKSTDLETNQFLDNSPRSLAKLNLSQPLMERRLFLSIDAQYRGRMETLTGSTISPFFIVNFTALGHKIGKRFDISGSIYNLLDKKYFDPPSNANTQTEIQQDGRSFRVKITWHLGDK
jgi:outer membrane cobalamin receptor